MPVLRLACVSPGVQQYPALGGMAPSPPQHTPLGSAHALPFSEPGSPASGRGLVGPGHAMLAHPHAHPGMHGVDRSGPYGISPPGYGHPVQIPPGYALVPTMPHQMPVSTCLLQSLRMLPTSQPGPPCLLIVGFARGH